MPSITNVNSCLKIIRDNDSTHYDKRIKKDRTGIYGEVAVVRKSEAKRS